MIEVVLRRVGVTRLPKPRVLACDRQRDLRGRAPRGRGGRPVRGWQGGRPGRGAARRRDRRRTSGARTGRQPDRRHRRWHDRDGGRVDGRRGVGSSDPGRRVRSGRRDPGTHPRAPTTSRSARRPPRRSRSRSGRRSRCRRARPPSSRVASSRRARPTEIRVTEDEVRPAMSEPVGRIVEAARRTLAEAPPELTHDVLETGMFLTGGGGLLRGLDLLLSQECEVPVHLTDRPLETVVLGAGAMLEHLDDYRSRSSWCGADDVLDRGGRSEQRRPRASRSRRSSPPSEPSCRGHGRAWARSRRSRGPTRTTGRRAGADGRAAVRAADDRPPVARRQGTGAATGRARRRSRPGGDFTGANHADGPGAPRGTGSRVQGNILVGEQVVAAMADAYPASDRRALVDRLLQALIAGDVVGGDRRGRQSAALLVVREGGGYGDATTATSTCASTITRKPPRSSPASSPCTTARSWSATTRSFRPRLHLVSEMQRRLAVRGTYSGPATGELDACTRSALAAFAGG